MIAKGNSGNLKTADTTVVHHITWPHEVTYTTSRQPAVYEELSSMAFVNGYLTVMAREPEQVTCKMLLHLQELMEDEEAYSWPAVRSDHVGWLQHLEQGRATWGRRAR